jgi:hypothetical protein
MRAPACRTGAEGEEMTSLDERIAALFRKGSPIFGDADPIPPIDQPIAEEAPSEAVVSEPAGEETNATQVDDKPRWRSRGLRQRKHAHHWRDWI